MGLLSNLFGSKTETSGTARICSGKTRAGNDCRNRTTDPSGRCSRHSQTPSAAALIRPNEAGKWSDIATADPIDVPEPKPSMAKSVSDALTNTFRRAPLANEPGLTTGDYGHSNDAVRPPHMVDLSRSENLEGRNVVCIDLDGTIYSRENCCPNPPAARNDFGWSDDCDHVDRGMVERIEQLCDDYDAVPVILSWRGGGTDASRAWLDHVGVKYDNVFIPGSEDDLAGLEMNWTKDNKPDHSANRKQYGGGQVAFKQATVTALEKHVGATVVGSFDDNPKVAKAMGEYGVPHAVEAPNPARAAREAAKMTWKTSQAACRTCGETFDGVNTRRSAGDKGRCSDCAASQGSTVGSRSARSAGRPSADRTSLPRAFDDDYRDVPFDDGPLPDDWFSQPTDDELWASSTPHR